MGARKLHIVVDHKLLVGIYAEEKSLADINNPHLRNLAEKASRFRFICFHVRGSSTKFRTACPGTRWVLRSRRRGRTRDA
jgi:hypothetical protein